MESVLPLSFLSYLIISFWEMGKGMSDVTMERKLQLVQQIRSRYNEDQYDLYNRERILYGRTNAGVPRLSGEPGDAELPARFSSFRMRLLLALLLVAAVIAMDVNGIEVGGVTSDKILEVISMDYEEKIDEWVETLSQ